jgi:large subunit ribosomal protein L9
VKVLFTQDVLNVADAGQIKEVANGYARNYLFPRNLAVAATKGREKQLEQQKQAIERRRAKEIDAQQALAASIDGN